MTRPSTVTPARRLVALLTALLVLAGVGVSAGAPATAAGPPSSSAVSAASMSALLQQSLATPEGNEPGTTADTAATTATAPAPEPEPAADPSVAALTAEAPLTLVSSTLQRACFSPDGDGADDHFVGDLVFDRAADVVVTVALYGTTDVVRTMSGRTDAGHLYSLSWDGKRDDGATVPDARFWTVTWTATAVGGAATTTGTSYACVDTVPRVPAITGPSTDTVLAPGSVMTVQVTGLEDWEIDHVVVEDTNGVEIGRKRGGDSTTLEVPVQPGALPDGEHQLRPRLLYSDYYGVERVAVGVPVTYSVRSPATLTSTAERRYVWPEHEGLSVVRPVYVLEKTALLRGELVDASGTVVHTVVPEARVLPGEHEHVVTGRSGPDHQSPLIPEGVYTYRATAVFDDGRSASHELELGIAHGVPQLQIDPGDEAVVTPTFTATVTEATGLPVQSAQLQMRGSGWHQTVGSADAGTTPGTALALPVDLRPLQTDDRVDGYLSGAVRDPFGVLHPLPLLHLQYEQGAPPLEVTVDTAAATITNNTPLSFGVTANRPVTVDYHLRSQFLGHLGQLGSETLAAGTTSTWTWDSRLPNGDEVPEGDQYTVDVTVRTSGATPAVVRSRAVSIVRVGGTLSVSGGVTDGKVSGHVTFVLRPPAGLAVTGARLHGSGSTAWPDMTKQADGSWTFAVSTALVRNGPRALHAQMHYAGGDRDTPPLQVTYANPIAFGDVTRSGDRVFPHSAGQDQHSIHHRATQPGTVTTQVRDLEGTLLRTITGDAARAVVFDGRDDAGTALPSGAYRATVRLDDPVVPSSATRTFDVLVDASRAGTIRMPASGQTVEGSLRVELLPEPGTTVGAPWTASLRAPGALAGQDLGRLTQQADGSWAADFDVNGFRLGEHELVVRGSSSDWSLAMGAPAVPFTLAKKRLIGTTVDGGGWFSPDGDQYEDTMHASYTLARAATVVATVLRPDGTTAYERTTSKDLGGNHTWSWDGEVDGTPVPPGRYTLRLRATAADGETAESSAELGVMGTPGTLSGPDPTQPVTGVQQLVWTPVPGTTTLSVTAHSLTYDEEHPFVERTGGTWVTDVDLLRRASGTGGYPDGPHEFLLHVSWKDADGRQHETYVPPRRTILVGNPVQLLSAPGLGSVVSAGSGTPVQPFAGTYTADQDVVADAVVRQDGRVVRTLPAGTTPVRTPVVTWDGTQDDGSAAPAGLYSVTVTVAATNGSKASVVTPVEVRRGAPGRWVAPSTDSPLTGPVTFRYAAADGVTLSGAVLLDAADRPVGTVTSPQPGVFEATADVGTRLGDGTHVLRLSARWATATTPAGLVHPWQDPITVTVDDRPVVEDLPAPRYFTPNGDGDQDSYLAHYRTMTAGLTTTQWLTSADGATVRTLADGVPSRGQAGSAMFPCATVGTERACDLVVWDGEDDAGSPVPDGLYTLHVRVQSSAGQSAEGTTTIGVERRSPLTVDLAPGSSVAERQDLAYTPRPQFPAGATGPAPVTSVKVGVQQQTELRDAVLDGGAYRISFDLPSTYPAEFAFEERTTWRDPFGGEHLTVTPLPVVHDGRTLHVRLSTNRQRGPEPLVQTFVVEGFREDGGRVDWVLDPGNGAEPITGHLDHPYEPVRVPFTYPVRGAYEAKVVATAAGGTATRHAGITMYVDDRPPATPVVSWTVDPASSVAPADVTGTLTVSGEDGAAHSYSVDWGDGQTATGQVVGGSQQLTHRYATPGVFKTAATVVASRTGSTLTATSRAYSTVEVVPDEDPVAVLRDAGQLVRTVDGTPLQLDASASRPKGGLTYEWDFGDGTTSREAVVAKSWDTPRDEPYTVTLTVRRDGKSSTATQQVLVLDQDDASRTTVHVTDEALQPLPGAIVAWTYAGGTTRATTGPTGKAVLYGLPAGRHSVDVYAPGHQPAAASVDVAEGGAGSVSVKLKAGALADVQLDTAPISPTEAAEKYGYDPQAGDNSHLIEFTVRLEYTPEEPVQYDDGSWCSASCAFGWGGFYGGGGGGGGYWGPSGGPGAEALNVEVFDLPREDEEDEDDRVVVVMFNPEAGSLKELYDVQASVHLLTGEGSTASLQDVTATLGYDHAALSLADVNGPAQSDVQPLLDEDGRPRSITASAPGRFEWLLRGDQPGTWPVTVDVQARLAPFDVPVTLVPQEPAEVVVHGTDAYAFIAQVPTTVAKGVPSAVNLGFENLTGTTVYGLTVEMNGAGGEFVFLPDQGGARPVGDLGPGQTRFVRFDFVPSFTGTFELGTVVRSKAGSSGDLPDRVEPFTPPQEDQENAPQLTATPTEDGRTRLDWTPLDDATEYRVYVAGASLQSFDAPVVKTGQTTAVVDVPPVFTPVYDDKPPPTDVDKARKAIVQAVVKGQPQLRHPAALVSGNCTQQEQKVHSWTLKGCLAKDGTSWIGDSSKGALQLNGLDLSSADGDLKVRVDTASGALTTDKPKVTVSLHGAPGETGKLYEGPVSWDLSKDVTITPTATSLLGMPVKGTTVLKGSADGSAVGAVTAAVGIDLPGVLGTGDGATMNVVAHPVGGILASGTEIALGKRPLYGSTYRGTLSYGLEKGAGVWQLTADLLDAKDQKVSSVSGKLEISSTGTLAKGEIHATKVSVFGLFTAERLDLELSANWSAKAELTYKDGENRDREIKAGATYEVDDKTTKVKKVTLTVPYLTVPGLTILRNVTWTYGGDAAPGWSLAATIDRERLDAPSAEVGGGVVMNSLGTITSASITLKNVPLAGLSTITSATLSLDPVTHTYKGEAAISTEAVTPGGTIPPTVALGQFSIVNGELDDLKLAVSDLRMGAIVNVHEGSVEYSRAKRTWSLSATKADLFDLVGVQGFTASKVGDVWSFTATGDDGDGYSKTVSASMTFKDGGITAGTLTLSGLRFGKIIQVGTLTLGYAPATGWTMAAGSPNPDGYSVALTVKDGRLESGRLVLPKVLLAKVAEIGLDLSYDRAQQTWAASGTATLPSGETPVLGLGVSYKKGELQQFSLSGRIGLKGGLTVKIDKLAWDRATDAFTATGVGFVLPGPAGTTVEGSIALANGEFTSGKIDLKDATIPLGPGELLTDAGLALQMGTAANPSASFSGTLGFGLGVPNGPIVAKVKGTVTFTYRTDGTAVYALDGEVQLMGMDLAQGGFLWDTRAEASVVRGSYRLGVPQIAHATGSVAAQVARGGFTATAASTVTLLGVEQGGKAYLDTTRFTACVHAVSPDWSIGFDHVWKTGATTAIERACSIPVWQPTAGGALRLSAVSPEGETTVDVEPGLPVQALKLVGPAAPDVVVTAPDGSRFPIDAAQPGAQHDERFFVLRDDQAQTTYVFVDDPQPGAWRVAAQEGSELLSVEVAGGTRAAQVTGAVSGEGTSRTLAYTVTELPEGQTVTVMESVEGDEVATPQAARVLGTVTGQGTLPFTTTPGAGERRVHAVVTDQDGRVLADRPLATYRVDEQPEPSPSPSPTTPPDEPSPSPSPSPSDGPTSHPSPSPTTPPADPSPSPSDGPTSDPSPSPTPSQTTGPTPGPTSGPTPGPTEDPDASPSPERPVPSQRDTSDACPAGRVPTGAFTDVRPDDVHGAMVDCLSWWGIGVGRGDRSYGPVESVTRAQMATFLTRVLEASGVPLPADPPDAFDDDAGSVHERAIDQLAVLGIVLGRNGRSFAPADPVDRAAMASFLVRTVTVVTDELPARAGDVFVDDDGSPHEDAVDRAAALGMVLGTGQQRYAPLADVRRDQMASFLMRMVDVLVEREHAVPPS